MLNDLKYTSLVGYPSPFGTSFKEDGVNFALFAKHATGMVLSIYDENNAKLLTEIKLNPEINKTGSVWHILIKGLPTVFSYAYRLTGPTGIKGYIADPHVLALDPYAKVLNSSNVWGLNLTVEEAKSKMSYHPRAVVCPEEPFDWQGVKNPKIDPKDLIIYEMHVRGLTQHPTSGVEHKGTFLGVMEKIPYFVDLGINALEFLPSQEFNEMEMPRYHPKSKEPLYQYWGYSTVNFFSLMNRYASSVSPGAVINEFKTMVRELHRSGIELILDVVFNHTSEALGSTLSYRAIENPIYYMLNADGVYLNFTGCGNTFNCNQPVSIELILDCLRYFVTEFHVDGFRFDLASVFARDTSGTPLSSAPIIEALTEDPILANTLLIAEPWDVGGLYQVGGFSKDPRWAEWNGKYRDSVRRFIKGNAYEKQNFATRLAGSQDLYGNGRSPKDSINFITAHDGFTLNDLVSYNQKHNLDNGEKNRDGFDANDSWNCGVEGPSHNKKIQKLREQQKRNLILSLMVSQGVPMLLMGDEYGHTRHGNNNTWGQDNELNWFLWDEIQNQAEFNRFYKMAIKLRKNHPVLRLGRFLTPEDIDWHGLDPFEPNWGVDDRLVAFTMKDSEAGHYLYVAFNASHNPVTLKLPPPPEGKVWHRIVDTHALPPQDFYEDKDSPPVKQHQCRMAGYSALVLKAL